MLALAFTFPGGRYHATPWGRHVNEADLEWPPSPWRILRALTAVWHRKLDPLDRDPALFEGLLASLATTPPLYSVPLGIHTHSRHYMPARSGKADKNTLIFDAFARVSEGEALIVSWPDLELDGAQTALVDSLAERLGFLGRAESWVDMRRCKTWDDQPNCLPADQVPEDWGDERLTLMTPMPTADYAGFRAAQLEGLKKRSDLKPKDKKAIAATLPESWLDAIGVESAELRAAGWNIPPASRDIPYRVQGEILRSNSEPSLRSIPGKSTTTFRFAIYGKPLPRVEDTVRMGEWLRLAAMHQAKKTFGEDSIPPLISGHGLPDDNRHHHAFWLPEDADKDGKIDHLIVHVPASLEDSAQQAIKGLRRIWNREGQEWRLLFEGAGRPEDVAGLEPEEPKICGRSKGFVSLTPYLMPWHAKPNFGREEQIRRECRARGLPEIDRFKELNHVKIGSRYATPIAFHRFRSRRGLTQPDRHGAFLQISFTETIDGPLALGFGCHFGLGLFACQPGRSYEGPQRVNLNG